METTDIVTQVISLLSLTLVIGVGYLVASIRKKIVDKGLKKIKPLNDELNKILPDYFKPVLMTTYQKYIKPIYKMPEWTPQKQEEVFNVAFNELLKLLPDFVVRIAKSVKSDWQEMLKSKMASYLELNKKWININTIQGGE